MTEPLAYIAHKDNHWCGIASNLLSRKELARFLGDFAADGFSITTVHDHDEYKRVLAGMKHWHEHPEFKAMHPKVCSENSRGPLGLD